MKKKNEHLLKYIIDSCLLMIKRKIKKDNNVVKKECMRQYI